MIGLDTGKNSEKKINMATTIKQSFQKLKGKMQN
jgi:hypothetical protein